MGRLEAIRIQLYLCCIHKKFRENIFSSGKNQGIIREFHFWISVATLHIHWRLPHIQDKVLHRIAHPLETAPHTRQGATQESISIGDCPTYKTRRYTVEHIHWRLPHIQDKMLHRIAHPLETAPHTRQGATQYSTFIGDCPTYKTRCYTV